MRSCALRSRPPLTVGQHGVFDSSLGPTIYKGPARLNLVYFGEKACLLKVGQNLASLGGKPSLCGYWT